METKELVQLQLKGSSKEVKLARMAVNIALSILQEQQAQSLKWTWDECGYTDSVGGHHDAGVGWMPDGHYCGECTKSTCEICSIWKGKQARQEFGGILPHRMQVIN